MTEPAPMRMSRMILGAVLGVAGHALAAGVGFVAGRSLEPRAGGGFEDLAAVAVGFLGTELVVALACLVGGIVLLARGRRDLGVGLLVGWVVGAAVAWFLIGVR
jgi:hypothetical protein